MYDALKKVEIVDNIKKKIVAFTRINNLEQAGEIARRWVKD